MMRRTLIALYALLFCCETAHAVTTFYAESGQYGYDGSGPYNIDRRVLNPLNAGSVPDGLFAEVGRLEWIAFEADPFFTGGDIIANIGSVTGSGRGLLYVGRTAENNRFSNLDYRFVDFNPGENRFYSPARQAHCEDIGGCNAFILQSWVDTTFTLDAAVAPMPEPGAWSLMLLGFFGLAARLKSMRRAGVQKSGAFSAVTPRPLVSMPAWRQPLAG